MCKWSETVSPQDFDSRSRRRRHGTRIRFRTIPRFTLVPSQLSVYSFLSIPSPQRRRPYPTQNVDSRLEMAHLHITVLGTTAALPLMLLPAREKQCRDGCHCRSRRAEATCRAIGLTRDTHPSSTLESKLQTSHETSCCGMQRTVRYGTAACA